MPPLTSALASVLLLAASTFSAVPAALEIPLSAWEPEDGDNLVIDTEGNEGYLLHADGRYIRFPVITGQTRVVSYIGLVYDATTPAGTFAVRSRHVKGDRITYGPTGRFLRLYDAKGFTHYGIHEHAAEDVMFARKDRFQSMGCVIVPREMMDILDETYSRNGAIRVVTQYGVGNPVAAAFY